MAQRYLAPVARSVRRVLAGKADGQTEVTARIRSVGGEGWFQPGDPIWVVHGSVTTFLGGIRALFLQSLHPLALAGVNQYSSYQDDPFGRLQRTGAFIAATTYGSHEVATQTVEAVRRIHTSVHGVTADGEAYSAEDPRLLLWVHVTLVDSMLTAYERFGFASGPHGRGAGAGRAGREDTSGLAAGRADADGYVRNMAVVGRAMGVQQPPQNRMELQQALADFRPELRTTRQTADMRRFILEAPMPPNLRLGYRLMTRTALDVLPTWAKPMLGVPQGDGVAVRSRRLATAGLLRVLSLALSQSPAQAAGEERLGRGGSGVVDQ